MMEKVRFPLTELRYWDLTTAEPSELERQLALFSACPDAFDEVWLGTLTGLPPLEQHAECARRNALAADKFRKLGVGVSLQVCETFGHWGYGAASYAAWHDWHPMVGHDGATNPHVPCPFDEDFLSYEMELIRLYAAAIRPTTIWYDDDLRLNNHGKIRFGCFCDRCLEEFAALSGRFRNRPDLVAELGRPRSKCRMEWIDFNRKRLLRFARGVAEAAHAVAPESRLAIQNCTGAFLYNCGDFNAMFREFAAVTGRPAGVRPGGGAYTEFQPEEFINKAIALQVTACAALDGGAVDLIPAEVENYPHDTLGKSAYATAFEGALYLATGCNALSFVLGPIPSKNFEEEVQYFQEIAAFRPIYEALSGLIREGARPSGLDFGRTPAHVDNVDATEMNWTWTDYNDLLPLVQCGIPAVWRDSVFGSGPAVLTAATADGLDQAAFDQLLRQGVLLDGESFHLLQQKGLTAKTGIISEPAPERIGYHELFTDDPLNGECAGFRYFYPANFGRAFRYHASGTKIRELGHLLNRADGSDLGISSLLLELPDGGRLALTGLPGRFNRQLTFGKQRQLLRMADFITRGTLPVLPASGALLWPIPLSLPDGSLAGVTIVNPSIAPLPPTRITLRHVPSGSGVRCLRRGVAAQTLETQNTGDGTTLTCPGLPAWSLEVLLIDPPGKR